MTKNSKSKTIVCLMAFAVLLRAVFIYQLGSSDVSGLLSLDSRFYTDLAEGMLSGAPLSNSPLTFNPFYPLLLFVLFKILGPSLTAVRVVQSLVGLVNLYLIYVITSKLLGYGRRRSSIVELGAVVAFLMALLYENLMFYEGAILATTFVILFLLVLLYLSLRIEEFLSAKKTQAGRPPGKVLFALSVSGALAGIGATARPNIFLVLVFLLPAWFAARFWKRFPLVVPSFLIPALLVLSLPISYNYSKGAGFVPVVAHGGINLYIGNGPEADGLFKPPGGMRTDMRGLIEDARAYSERAMGKKLTHSEVSSYWAGRTFDYVRLHPFRWIRLMLRKLYFFFNGTEVPDVLDRSLYVKSCPVLKVCFLPLSLISALSMAGIVLLLIRWKDNALFLLFFLVSILSVIIFYVNTRYRLPSVPLMIISGAYFIATYVGWLQERRYAGAVLFLGVFLGSFFLVAGTHPIEVNRSALYTFLGNFYMQNNDEERAFEAFSTAYELDPRALETKINYARLLKRRKRFEEAEGLYSKAFRERPDFPNLAIEYGSLLEKMGRRDEARAMYLYAFRSGSNREKVFACKLLSRLSYVGGDRDGAIEWIRRALEFAPKDAELIRTLNRLEER